MNHYEVWNMFKYNFWYLGQGKQTERTCSGGAHCLFETGYVQ